MPIAVINHSSLSLTCAMLEDRKLCHICPTCWRCDLHCPTIKSDLRPVLLASVPAAQSNRTPSGYNCISLWNGAESDLTGCIHVWKAVLQSQNICFSTETNEHTFGSVRLREESWKPTFRKKQVLLRGMRKWKWWWNQRQHLYW